MELPCLPFSAFSFVASYFHASHFPWTFPGPPNTGVTSFASQVLLANLQSALQRTSAMEPWAQLGVYVSSIYLKESSVTYCNCKGIGSELLNSSVVSFRPCKQTTNKYKQTNKKQTDKQTNKQTHEGFECLLAKSKSELMCHCNSPSSSYILIVKKSYFPFRKSTQWPLGFDLKPWIPLMMSCWNY